MNALKLAPALLAAATLGCAPGLHKEGKHWAYDGHGGPENWAEVDPAFATCRVGNIQSPIDIRGAKAADLAPIKFDYKPSPLKVVDNGHTIQVNYAPGSAIVVGGARYELLQFHFHTPSEEKIDGRSSDMVAHLVHRSEAGKLAVVAVLLDTGGANPVSETIWKNLPREKQKESAPANVAIDATGLLPRDRGYYAFQGSLTTPPCSEDVSWLVLKTPVKVAESDIAAFARLYPMNARPTQPLNGRAIEVTR